MNWSCISKALRAAAGPAWGAWLLCFPPTVESRGGDGTDSLLARASLAVRGENWSEGADLADEILARGDRSLDAHYYGAICRRELGKRTSLVFRQIQWDKARKHFSAVFARDSSFRDILYQSALFQEYDDELEDALDAARAQIIRHPEQVESGIGLLRIGSHYVSATDPVEAERWLGKREDPYSRFFLAELLRRHGQFARAESLLLRLQEGTDIAPQVTCLALARLYAALGEGGEALAQATYWNGAANAVTPFGAAVVFGDIAPVIDDEELARYRTLRTEEEWTAFFRAFWETRDPAPASPVNARLIEHLRRYAKAEKEYEYFGVRTLSSNPDPTLLGRLPQSFDVNREFNDMGLIYLRHGAPDAVQVTSSSGDDDVSWRYDGSVDSPPRIFIFARRYRVANDWRLTSIPTNAEMRDKLSGWDSRYGVDPQRWPQVGADLEAERGSSVTLALRSEHHVWEGNPKRVVVPHAIEAFRAADGKTLLDVSYAVTLDEFAEGERDTQRTLPLEVGISFISLKGGKSRRELDTLRIPFGAGTEGSYISLIRRTLLPDSLRVAMHVRTLGGGTIGTWSEFVSVPSFTHPGLALSDLQILLPSERPASIEIDGVKILQSPFRAYRRSSKIFAYLQIYNLVRDIEGKTEYTAAYELIPSSPPRPDRAILLEERTKDLAEESSAEFIPLNLGAAPPGTYVLRATVTDRKRVETLTREREIEILP